MLLLLLLFAVAVSSMRAGVRRIRFCSAPCLHDDVKKNTGNNREREREMRMQKKKSKKQKAKRKEEKYRVVHHRSESEGNSHHPKHRSFERRAVTFCEITHRAVPLSIVD